MIFPYVKQANTKMQIHKYTNTEHTTKCQKEEKTCGIFLKQLYNSSNMINAESPQFTRSSFNCICISTSFKMSKYHFMKPHCPSVLLISQLIKVGCPRKNCDVISRFSDAGQNAMNNFHSLKFGGFQDVATIRV